MRCFTASAGVVFIARSNENFTSFAVNVEPSWNFESGNKVNCQVVASMDFHDFASVPSVGVPPAS
jgi:hypothetical protein